MNKPVIIGLTGQTGAGKTTVSALFAKNGFAVINADLVARQVVVPHSPCLREIIARFGSDLLLPDGSLNRKAAAKLIFTDPAAKDAYLAIIFPYIRKEIDRQMNILSAKGESMLLLDAPTLFESGCHTLCDGIVSVIAPEAVRLSRICHRDKLSETEGRQRMASQLSEAYFITHSRWVISNQHTLESLCAQTQQVITQILSQYHKGGTLMGMSKDELKALKESLLMEKKHAAQKMEENEIELADAFCKEYMQFLDVSKTEREAADEAVRQLEANGFRRWQRGESVTAGDRIYVTNRGKAVIAAVIGTKALAEGIRLTAAHIDAPRLDLKQSPLYEDTELALLKTHYYGGIKKYQWTTIPMAMHGVIVKKDGSSVTVNIGEAPTDPVFCITDLLPHLATEQVKRTLGQGIHGEELNVLIGSRPIRTEEGGDLVKLRILQLLNEKYGIIESDFLSAELEIVPAGNARDLGFDRSMIGAYGHDDRVCAYPALAALMQCTDPAFTAVTILTDKEEIGSDGNTGLCSSYFHDFMRDLATVCGTRAHIVFSASQCLSADVTAAYDPTFSDVNDRRNCAYLNYGVCMMKYTGARGKSGSSDASAEFVGTIRNLFDANGVIWQTGELGKVDIGGGGTVAAYLANLNMDTVDVGVPVLSMHAPMEVVSKLDVYQAYRAFLVFQQTK